MSGQNLDNDIKVAIARGIHLFPFRTEKLSLVTPMVLRNSGRVGSRRLEKGESRKREESVERLAPFFGIYTSRCRDGGVPHLILSKCAGFWLIQH